MITPLREYLVSNGISIGSVARATGANKATVSAFINGRKLLKRGRDGKRLRSYFRQIGALPTPKLRPRCTCPSCGKVHTQGKDFAEAGIPNVVRVDVSDWPVGSTHLIDKELPR